MKPRPPWLGKYDEPILEFYAESDMAAPPAVVRFNLEWKEVASPAHSTVKRRVRKLADHGLLEKVDDEAGYYAISEKGLQFLAGELDADELEEQED